MVRVKAVAMNTPWAMRRAVNTIRSGATVRSDVGIASRARLIQLPLRRSIRRLTRATRRPAAAMPMVLALTAKPMAARLTWYVSTSVDRIAWAANRSTKVRKPITPISRPRAASARERAAVGAGLSRTVTVMTLTSGRGRGRERGGGRPRSRGARVRGEGRPGYIIVSSSS